MDDEKPVWRQMFDAADAELAPRLEEFVRTPEFADAMALMNRLNEQAVRSSTEFNRQMLDFWNIPSKAEVTELKQRVAALERQIHNLTKTLREGVAPSTTPTSGAAESKPGGAASSAAATSPSFDVDAGERSLE